MEEKRKILVVDDDSGLGEMLKTLLEFYEYEAYVTERPQEVEELIVTKDINLVILDMLIAGVNGTDVCIRLREHGPTAKVPILMMSGLHNAGEKCRKAGASDFIAKPFEMEDLREKIEKILGEVDTLK